MSSSYTEALVTYNEQRFRPDYKMTFKEMWTLANTLDVMRDMVNVHDSGPMPGTVYHHIEQAEKSVLGHLYGPVHADQIIRSVIESGESIAYVMEQMREDDHFFAHNVTGYLCKECDTDSPVGVGYVSGPLTGFNVAACECGYSVKPACGESVR